MTSKPTKIPPQDQPIMVPERLTYTINEAARLLGISRAVAYRPGVLPTIRVAGRLLVPRDALHQMLSRVS